MLRKISPLYWLTFGVILLAACAFDSGGGTETGTGISDELPVSPTPSPTPQDLCRGNTSFSWATKHLEEITAQFQGALLEAGLQDFQANVFAFGENIHGFNTQTGESVLCGFATMETDFDILITVEDLGDHDLLGNQSLLVLEVLEDFPRDQLPKPAGMVTVRFMEGDKSQVLRFTMAEGADALENGLTGASLLEALSQ